MQNEELCKKVISEIMGREVARIERPQVERSIKIALGSRGIRLDVYFSDEMDHVYNIEIQNYKESNLPKRARYYNSIIDMNLLEEGQHYDELNDVFVIFICTYDPFERGRGRYTFKRIELEDATVEYEDGSTCIIFNTEGDRTNESRDLNIFLDAVKDVFSNNEFSDRIKKEVARIKHNDMWRVEYMSQELREYDMMKRARKEGREEGRQELVVSMYIRGILDKEEAISELSVSEEELKELVEKYEEKAE